MENQETQSSFITVPATEHYNLTMLEMMDDNEYLLEILNIFLRDTELELKEMKEALKAGRTEVVAEKAHKIKGSASVIEAMELYNLLYSIEKIAMTGTIDNSLKSLVEDTQQLYNIIAQSLKLHIKQLK